MLELHSLLERTVEQVGYELVDFEMSGRGKLLRLFIDKPGGVTIDDCALVSEQVSHVLAVEFDVDYDRLEVSSPGLDRVLKKEEDFVRFTGVKVTVKTRIAVEGRKNFVGILRGIQHGVIRIECDGIEHRLEMSNVEKARLSPEF